jgi:hypothetical protein
MGGLALRLAEARPGVVLRDDEAFRRTFADGGLILYPAGPRSKASGNLRTEQHEAGEAQMALRNVCRLVEDAADIDRFARIESAASSDELGDWLVDKARDYGVTFDERALDAVKRLVARAMIAQHEYDERTWISGVMSDAGLSDTEPVVR